MSLSSFVRSSVRPSVRNLFFLLVSLEFVVHLKCQQGDQRCLKGVSQVSRVFQRSFKGVSWKFQGYFKEVSRKFQRCFKEVSRLFHESFKEVEVSRMFHDFQGCSKSVS